MSTTWSEGIEDVPVQKSRAYIMEEANRIQGEIKQIFSDADHWNRNHPNEEPIDPDPDGALERLLAGTEKVLFSGITLN